MNLSNTNMFSYPFEEIAGTKNVYDHQSILKILTNDEAQNFIEHSGHK